MHDQRGPVAEDGRPQRRARSQPLLDADNQPPWSTEELFREVGDRIAMADALARLYSTGLVHRIGAEFGFATWSALRAAALAR